MAPFRSFTPDGLEQAIDRIGAGFDSEYKLLFARHLTALPEIERRDTARLLPHAFGMGLLLEPVMEEIAAGVAICIEYK